MNTPFDDVIELINVERYHNHRRQVHSDVVSDGVFRDLLQGCETLREDYEDEIVKVWKNVRAPGDRERRIDLFVGEPDDEGKPDLKKVRLALENKSVVTAHRNKDARFDDLKKVLDTIHREKQEAVIVATVLVGLADRVLNIPDQLKKFYKTRMDEFRREVLPRLSSGDESLWDEFPWAVSENRPDDPKKTAERFNELPTRNPAHTHVSGYDCLLLVPVYIDNVHPATVPRDNQLGIDIDTNYREMLARICKAYMVRWHP